MDPLEIGSAAKRLWSLLSLSLSSARRFSVVPSPFRCCFLVCVDGIAKVRGRSGTDILSGRAIAGLAIGQLTQIVPLFISEVCCKLISRVLIRY
jgi:hypothetical protein